MGHAENKRERMEQMELMLQSTRDCLSIQEIAERLDCDLSTAYRYLRELEQRRAVIEIHKGCFRLNPSESLSNVRLHPNEALTIYLALRRFVRQTGYAPDFMINAIQKIIPALQRPDLVETLMHSTHLLRAERSSTTQHATIWESLLRGWLENVVVRLQYQKLREDETDEHEFEPYLFEPMVFGHGTYVIGWSRTRNNIRTFKIERIKRAALTTQQFERRTHINVDDLLRNAWGIWYGEQPMRVSLLFPPHVTARVLENVWHPSEVTELLPDGSLLWSVEVVGDREILPWVRSWGSDVKVLEPEFLKRQIIDDLRATLAQYEEE